MTPVPVLDAEGLAAGSAALAGPIAETPIKQHLIHETVVAELAARRAGTIPTKTRSEVRGGGSKPWRQKGTGRARVGSSRSPRGPAAASTFGPTPRSYGGKVNRKVAPAGVPLGAARQVERGTAAIMDATGWDAPSTKRAAEYLRQAPDGLATPPAAHRAGGPRLGRGPRRSATSRARMSSARELETVTSSPPADPGAALRVGAPDRRARRRPGRDPRADQEARAEEDGAAEAEAGPQGLRKKAAAADEAPAAEMEETQEQPVAEVEDAVVQEAPAEVVEDAPAEEAPVEETEDEAEEAPAEEPVPRSRRRGGAEAEAGVRKKAAPAEEPAAEAEEDAS